MTELKVYPPLDSKPVIAVAPISIAAAGTAVSAAIDTLGFDGFTVATLMGVGDSALATTLTESDTSGGSYTAVNDEAASPAAVSIAHAASGATGDGTLGAGPGYFRTDRRKRFIKVTITATGGAASLAACLVTLVGPRDSKSQNVTYSYKL